MSTFKKRFFSSLVSRVLLALPVNWAPSIEHWNIINKLYSIETHSCSIQIENRYPKWNCLVWFYPLHWTVQPIALIIIIIHKPYMRQWHYNSTFDLNQSIFFSAQMRRLDFVECHKLRISEFKCSKSLIRLGCRRRSRSILSISSSYAD